VVLGVSCFFLLVDSPALSTRWLTTDEIRFLELRHLVHHSAQVSDLDTRKKQKWAILKSILLDWKIYTLALVYWSNIVPNLGLKFTMPQIIKNMGFTSSNAQLMTIPPYMCGALSAYVSARLADRYTWRMPFIVGPQFLVVISFAILFPLSPKIKDNVGVCYFAVILSCLGLYPISPGTSAWTVNNLAGPTKRAQGVAYMLTIGNAGGIISSFIYRADEAPRYATGFGTSLAFAAAGILACFALEYGYHQINRKRAMLDEDAVRAEYRLDELTLMGDKSPLFRYTL
jgi:MFS family permease